MIRDANDVNVAEFAYDALSRRIEKKDLVDANNTRRYYYNYKWQVLCEYDDANDLRNYYIYGNYIDEALIVQDAEVSNWNYYVHDHLYSTVALLEWNGTVVERYEYDAYGRCTILDPNYAVDADQKSDYSNPYLFTGRRLDTLDDGKYEMMYYRNRYYAPATGRFLTHDPLGITPNPQRPNKWGIKDQYRDGTNFYEYVKSNTIIKNDPYGLSFEMCPGAYRWMYSLQTKCYWKRLGSPQWELSRELSIEEIRLQIGWGGQSGEIFQYYYSHELFPNSEENTDHIFEGFPCVCIWVSVQKCQYRCRKWCDKGWKDVGDPKEKQCGETYTDGKVIRDNWRIGGYACKCDNPETAYLMKPPNCCKK